MEGSTRPDPLADQVLAYVWFAERYQWTPQQVDEQIPGWLLDWIPPAARMIDEVTEARAKRESTRNGGSL